MITQNLVESCLTLVQIYATAANILAFLRAKMDLEFLYG